MKKLLFLLFFFALNVKSQSLHLIVVSDITDATFGTISSADITSIETDFKGVASQIDYKFQPIFLSKADFNSASTRKTINQLQTKPNDIIVFYYSGLGDYSTNTQSPFLRFEKSKKDSISMDEIEVLLNKKGVRLGLAMADLRNTFPAFLNPPRGGFGVVESFLKLAYQKLFLESCGIYKVVSHSKGGKSFINQQKTKSLFAAGIKQYFENLQYVDVTQYDNLTIDNFLSRIQSAIGSQLDENEYNLQKLNIEKLPCRNSQTALIKKMPVFKNIPTVSKINEDIEIYGSSKIETERNTALQRIQNSFVPENKITLITISNSGEKTEQVTLKDFINEIKKINSETMKIQMMIFDLSRSKDYQKYTQATFTKVLNQ